MADDRFLIVTGLSGSGKSTISRYLEDFGYYCVDNLPAKLIPSFVNLWQRREVEIERVALTVDIREKGFEIEFPAVLKSIRKKISPFIIFLEASDAALINRFSESRRPHPIKKKKSMRESVALERKSLQGIKNMADEVIDTTSTSAMDLKKILVRKFLKKKPLKMKVVIISFGYKYGIPLDSDLVFDTRFLPNPFYVDELREKTGKDPDVRKYVLQAEETKTFLQELFHFVDYLMPHFLEEGKSFLTISVGCTGGKHRSVVLATELKKHLRKDQYGIQVNHRDIFK